MDYIGQWVEQRGGFTFENARRNEMLTLRAPGLVQGKFPTAMKTGTTICGVKCGDAVVLGADTRATEDIIVADKNCEKLHKMASNIWCAGAGTSADLEHTTELMASKLELHRMATNTQPRVASAVNMLSHFLFKYQGHIGCALVLGGVDIQGPTLFKVYPHGSTDRSPFAAMGSGSLCAEGRLESEYRDGMSVEEGKALVASAIRAGIMNDLGSGGHIDLVVIERDRTTYLRNYEKPVDQLKRQPQTKSFPIGSTAVLLEKIKAIKSRVVETEEEENDAGMMDVEMI